MDELAVLVDELAIICQHRRETGLVVIEHPRQRGGSTSCGRGKVNAGRLGRMDGLAGMGSDDMLAGPRQGVVKI